MIIGLLAATLIAFASWSFISLELNYRRARTMGEPVIRLLIDPLNLPWQILEVPILSVLDHFHISLGTFGIYARRGWQFADKARSHEQLGSVYAIATPRAIWLQVAEPDAIADLLKRRADFARPYEIYALLEVYGPCISTARQHDWARHRKVLASPFNEGIMEFVWRESCRQTEQMLKGWLDSKGLIRSYARDTRTLSLNVLAATGFRKSYDFVAAGEETVGETRTYRDALQLVLDNVITLMVLPAWVLRLPIMSKTTRRVGSAAATFQTHMVEMFEEETRLADEGKPGTGGLMTAFLQALKTASQADKASSSIAKGLSREEIYGNIFVINFAGHDTTANTLAFSMLLLALNPGVQQWVAEELQTMRVRKNGELPSYRGTHSRLKRCQAVMLETLRLYPPIMAIPKQTANGPRRLRVGGKSITVPANTYVQTMVLAMHTHPEYWESPLEWRPSRWISSRTTGPQGSSGDEEIFEPPPGMYIPWSDGPQNCPGAKFSQVEYVAVLATLLEGHRITLVPEEGEELDQARRAAEQCLKDCDMQMLLRLRNADRVQLRCIAVGATT